MFYFNMLPLPIMSICVISCWFLFECFTHFLWSCPDLSRLSSLKYSRTISSIAFSPKDFPCMWWWFTKLWKWRCCLWFCCCMRINIIIHNDWCSGLFIRDRCHFNIRLLNLPDRNRTRLPTCWHFSLSFYWPLLHKPL